MRVRLFRSLMHVGLVGLLAVLVGCATAEVKSARQSLETARSAGKDKECPNDFAAAEQLVNQAEALCQQCKTQEANALANQATAKVNALCPAKPTPPPPPPAPPSPAAAPTVSLSAASTSIEQGACTTLNWTTTNARSTSIDQGVGAVDASGSRQVCPTSTTRYTLTANGDGGTRSDSATVNVAAKPTPTDKLTIHVNFETNKSDIRKADVSDLRRPRHSSRSIRRARSRSTATRTRPVARRSTSAFGATRRGGQEVASRSRRVLRRPHHDQRLRGVQSGRRQQDRQGPIPEPAGGNPGLLPVVLEGFEFPGRHPRVPALLFARGRRASLC